jgi:hypothetical protein
VDFKQSMVKVKFTPKQVTNAQRGSRCTISLTSACNEMTLFLPLFKIIRKVSRFCREISQEIIKPLVYKDC